MHRELDREPHLMIHYLEEFYYLTSEMIEIIAVLQ